MLAPQTLASQASGLSVPPTYIFVAIVIILLARITWRTIANFRGTVFSLTRTVVYACVYIGLGVLFSTLSYFEGVSCLLVAPQVAIAAMAAVWSYRYSDKRISFWNSEDGRLFFRGGVVIYLIYLAGFVVRLSIDLAFVGPSIFGIGTVAALSGAGLYGSMAADILLTFGVGLLLGRNVRVVQRFRRIRRGEETVPSKSPELATPVSS